MIKKLINDFKISKLLLIRIIFIIKLEKLDILPKNILIDNIYSLNDLSRYIDENITHFSKLFSKDISYDFSDEIIESLLDLCNYDFDYNIFSEIYNMNLDVNFLKKDGIFYTPDAIVECILNNTVHNFKNDLKILYHSCGTGIFLIKCVDVLYPIYKDSDLISGFLYGVDLDEKSVEICKISLFLKFLSYDKNYNGNNLDENIRCGDSLISNKDVSPKALNTHKNLTLSLEILIMLTSTD